MNFNSLSFLIFLPVVLVLYWLTPHKYRWALLLAASYYFYMSWNPWLVFLIVGTTLVSYLAALAIEKTPRPERKRLWLVLTLIVCLGVLVFFKYFNFLLQTAVDFLNLFSLHLEGRTFDILLPIGISFYTFQTLSYVIDVSRGKFPAEHHLGYYALFVCFFPQLVAGPIERPKDLLPQLREKHTLNWDDLSCGMRIMAVGFFLKCAVADVLAVYVNRVFAASGEANALAILLAGFLFTAQMYCDFAGYSEIATGCSRMMGIRLSRNFDRPYQSLSYSDFFRRWHITLTRWFTDYVYIPLGGSRCGAGRRIFNTFVVFALCGLWHGANFTYLAWGMYAAFFLSLEAVLTKPAEKLREKAGISKDSRLLYGAKILGTYCLLIPGGIIFRASSLAQVGEMLGRLFTKWGLGRAYFDEAMAALGMDARSLVHVTLCLLCEFAVWHYAQIGRDKPLEPLPDPRAEAARSARNTVILVFLLAAVMLSWAALLSSGDTSAFQYFQF